jgi:hypothetical protein
MECLATVGLVVVVVVLVVDCSSVVLQAVCCSGRVQGRQYWKKMLTVLAQVLQQERVVLQNHRRISAAQLQIRVWRLHKQQRRLRQLMMTAAA